MKHAHGLLSLLALSATLAPAVRGELGTCLREIILGQDSDIESLTPKNVIGFGRAYRKPVQIHDNLVERDGSSGGLQVVIAAGGGLIDISDITGIGTSNNNNNNNNNSGASSSISSPNATPASTTEAQSTSTTSSSSTAAASTTSSTDTDSNEVGAAIASGSYSQEPTELVYTCKSEFIDFSTQGAMDKFSFVWCPQNAYQTSNSVVWRLTRECGTTMVYPWDFHYGKIEGRIRIGPTSGVVTSMLLLGPAPSDEIDFEWVGRNTDQVQTMYYVQSHRVDPLPQVFVIDQQGGGDLSTTFHDYAIELNSDSVKWYFDGVLRRTLNKGSQEFPTYASRGRMGIWDGTQTSGWAGTVDWSLGPFTAEMQWFNFTPYC
ncbi:putative glycosidase CRH2 [Coemansia interrupta]|uniref:Glycosidase CRH2 n=1 Tax=Coemansia interrupta TaxID=1126814 RepID=A0A9W8LIN4_9FUNG|nr:putative glycosidase CRH2 [Coemansia interrupta]